MITYTYIISNGVPGSTYLGATSAELAPTSEWVTQLPTLACTIFVKHHCPKRAPLDPLLALLRPLAVRGLRPEDPIVALGGRVPNEGVCVLVSGD